MKPIAIGDIISLDNENYVVVQIFTKSLSGNTYKVKNRRTGIYYVIKEFVDNQLFGERDPKTNRIRYRKKEESKSKAEMLCEKEIAFQRMVLSEKDTNNRYIFPMEESFYNSNEYVYAPLLITYTEEGIVLSEYCNRMQNDRDLGDIFMIVKAICHAVNSLHMKQVLHLDLKPDNLYLEKNKDSYLIKILDLGSAQKIGEFNYQLFSLSSGTVLFRSPNIGKLGNAYTECQRDRIISQLSFYDDIYSIANILMYLLLGKTYTEIRNRLPQKGERETDKLENDLKKYGMKSLTWCHSYLKLMFEKLKNKEYTSVIAENSMDVSSSFYNDVCVLSEIVVGKGYYPESVRRNGNTFMERYIANRGISIDNRMIPDIEPRV